MTQISTRGRTFTAVVVGAKMQLTATVEWERRKYISKFERYLTERARTKVHNPATINAVEGDVVKVMECRPISKSKHFVIIEKLGKANLFEAKKELLDAGKKVFAKKTQKPVDDKVNEQ